MVAAWVLVAVPLLAAAVGYTVWKLPAIATTAARSFGDGLTAARAGFSAGHPAAGLAALFNMVLLLLPTAGLLYLLARLTGRGARAAGRLLGWPRAPRRQRVVIVLSSLCAMAAGAAGTLALTVTGNPATGTAVAADSAQAAAWVAGQVSPAVTVACDAQTCGQIHDRGFPAGQLKTIQAGGSLPSGPSLIVATPAVQSRFGTHLAAAYAPLVLASFGTGAGRVEVRAVAPDGAAALQSRLSSGHDSLITAGAQLLQNKNLQAGPQARAAIQAGRVDSRLLVTFAAMAARMPVNLVALNDLSPGADSAVPLRNAELSAASAGDLSAMLAFLGAQQDPYRPASAALTRSADGRSVIAVQFDARGSADVGYP
jgi:hypothetical protein